LSKAANPGRIVFLPYEKYWLTSRFLIGWDAGVALYLTLVLVMVLRSGPKPRTP
jgi:hypothetical protein